jgi:cytidylate kinase
MTQKPSVPMVVAIDGVLGSGKTTVARRVADRLGIEYLDTGAMYRCIGFGATQLGVDLEAAAARVGSDRDAVVSLARRVVIEVLRNHDGSQTVRLDGADVTTEIRSPDAAKAASIVATVPEVRAELVDRQRVWARARGGGVLEGRDIASTVFPDAPTKVFLTASVEERARRRHAEQPDRSIDEVVADLEWRDSNDANRTADPLRVVDGATVIDTTGLDIDAVVDRIVALVPETDRLGTSAEYTERTAAAQRHPSSSGSGAVSDAAMGTGSTVLKESAVAKGPAVSKESTVPKIEKVDVGGEDAMTRRLRSTWGQRIVFRGTRLLVVPLVKAFFRVDYQGLQHVPKRGAFIVAPMHRSNVDFILLPRLSRRRMRFLGKDSIWKVKLLGPFFDSLGGIPVHRGSTDREAMRICSAILESGEPLVVFPEGSRKEGPVIEELFDGAAYLASKHKCPILPIGIGGSEASMPKGAKLPRPVKIRVVVGRPIAPPAGGRSSVRTTTAELRVELQRLFDDASS